MRRIRTRSRFRTDRVPAPRWTGALQPMQVPRRREKPDVSSPCGRGPRRGVPRFASLAGQGTIRRVRTIVIEGSAPL